MSATFRIASAKGTLLGTLFAPDYVARAIHNRDGARIPASFMPLTNVSADLAEAYLFDVQTFTIARSWHVEGAWEINGITLDDLEQWPGFSFSPSLAYIKSQLAHL